MPGAQSGSKTLKGATNAAQAVKSARARMTQGEVIKPEFDYELLLTFVRNELSAQLTIPLLAIIIALAAMFWAPAEEAAIWLVCVLFARAALVSLCHRFQRTPRGELNVESWRKTLTLTELVYGVAWAGIALVGMSPKDPSAHVFVFASLIVVLTIRLMSASTVMSIVYAGTVPMTAALVARLVSQPDPFYWAMASMAVGVHVYFIFLSKGLNSTVMAMLEFRAEKDSLIAELEQAKSISDGARRRAEAANLAKSRFLATMSHELRTPLNAILGFSEIMKAEMLGPHANPIYKEYSSDIHASGTHLLRLINEILDLSRIEAGRHELQEQAVSLAEIAADCCHLLSLKAEAKSLHLVEDFPPDLPALWADERAIRQICLNLISNAVKFTPPGGQIEVSVRGHQDGGQEFNVKDTGPGIPKDEIPKVLQAFGQGAIAHQNAEGGTGLGLPIVKSLTELHGGEFVLTSQLRKGTRVGVVFPAERVLERLEPLQPLGEERHGRTRRSHLQSRHRLNGQQGRAAA